MTERKTPAAGGSGDEIALAEQANRLYWESDSSVNRIADDLGLSKGALYNLVQPLAVETPCPDCGLEMAYMNRTARLKDFLGCPSCGFEAAAATLEAAEKPTVEDSGAGESAAEKSAEEKPAARMPARDEAAKKAASDEPAAKPAVNDSAAKESAAEPRAGSGPSARQAGAGAAESDQKSREPIGARSTAGGAKAVRPLVDFSKMKEAASSETGRSVLAGATLLGIAAGLLIVTLVRKR